MTDAPRLGARVRALRRRERLTQAVFAERIGISPSYLALIEGGRRPLTAPLLIEISRTFEVDLADFAVDDDGRVGAELIELFTDPIFEEHDLRASAVRDLVSASPEIARAVLTLARAWRSAQEQTHALADAFGLAAAAATAGADDDQLTPAGTGEVPRRLLSSRLPAEEVSDALQAKGNHYPRLEEAAEALRAALGPLPAPADRASALTRHIERAGVVVRIEAADAMDGAVRRYDARRRRLHVSEQLGRASLAFQLAHQAALLFEADLLDALVDEAAPASPTARTLYRVALANYFAGAVLLPYDAIHAAATASGYDIELLMQRFDAGFEQVCHRLTTLRRPGAGGLPLHFIRVDIAGNISKRFSGSGIRFARFSGACPRWNVHSAFLTPGRIRTQISEMPGGERFFCIARTVERGGGGWQAPRTTLAVGLGTPLAHAGAMIYARGIDLGGAAPVPVGTTCRLCPRTDCAQRAMPPLDTPLRVDPDVRGLSFYAEPGG